MKQHKGDNRDHMEWKPTDVTILFLYLLGLYMFRAHRPIFGRVRTVVHTTIGSCLYLHSHSCNL